MIGDSLQAYIRHLRLAKGAYSLHSPFVFHLYTQLIRHRPSEAGKKIESFRQQLKQSSESIEVQDFGAGRGNTGGGTYRSTVGRLARKASRRRKVGELLYRLCDHFQPKRCLEFGTHLGISTLYQLSALQSSRFVSMEGAPAIAELARKHLTHFQLAGEILVGEFEHLLDHKVDLETFQPDYVFLDGNHRYEPSLRYVQRLLPCMTNGGMIILDDIYWSREMTQAWEEIIQFPEVTVSIDLFHVGICFLHRPQAKQHFRLRF